MVATAVCLFLTTWRTVIPLRLASPSPRTRSPPSSTSPCSAWSIGFDGGVDSPFYFCMLAALVVVAFGWGSTRGFLAWPWPR